MGRGACWSMKSMKVGKAQRPSWATSERKGFFRFVNPLNRKARFQSSGPRVIPYRYIKVREMF